MFSEDALNCRDTSSMMHVDGVGARAQRTSGSASDDVSTANLDGSGNHSSDLRSAGSSTYRCCHNDVPTARQSARQSSITIAEPRVLSRVQPRVS